MNHPVSITVVVLLGIATLLSVGLSIFIARQRDQERTLLAFALVCLSLGIWSGTYLLRVLNPDATLDLILMVITHAGIVSAPTSWFVFVLLYTGNEQWVTKRTLSLLLVHPVAVISLLVTNPYHHLLYESITIGTPTLVKELGPAFWPHVAYTYAILFIGITLLAYFAATSNDLYRLQSYLIFLGLAIPLGTNILFFIGANPLENIDPTPVTLSFGMAMIAGAVFYGRLIEFVPIAHATIISSLNEGVVVVTDDERIASANEAACEMLDVEKDDITKQDADSVLPKPVFELIGSSQDTAGWEKSTASGLSFYQVEHNPITTHGIRGHVLTFTDMTDSKQQRRKLQRQNERLDEFASVVSHDLRGPMTYALGYANKIADDYDEPPENLEKVKEQIYRMEEITDNVLELARNGQDINDIQDLKPETVAESAWNNIKTPGIAFTTDGEGSLMADPTRLKQLFENLFRNVNEHSGADSVRVEYADSVLSIEDDGRGIPAAERENVFEEGVTLEDDGTGLGLSIVKKIVDAHGWQINIESGSGGGARFTIHTDKRDANHEENRKTGQV